MLDYSLICFSRKRSANMPLIRQLIPSALVCIDEREVDDYAPFVPQDKLLLHPPLDGFPAVWNWVIENVDSEIVVEIDDDFRGVQVLTGSYRYTRDPDDILAIIENAARNMVDLDLTCFTFSKSGNRVFSKTDWRPIVPVGRATNCFGVRGAARRRKHDATFISREDVDFTLLTLLEDRQIYTDMRFFFDVGTIYSGEGGSVGLVTSDQFARASLELKKKWGKYLSYKSTKWKGMTKTVPTCNIAVRRYSNSVVR